MSSIYKILPIQASQERFKAQLLPFYQLLLHIDADTGSETVSFNNNQAQNQIDAYLKWHFKGQRKEILSTLLVIVGENKN